MDKDKTSFEMYINDIERNAKEIKSGTISFLQARHDKNMFNKIVKRNLGLVIKISKQYASRSLPLEDVVQEGNIGLMEAILKFDESRGFKFSTYAQWWIRYYIYLAVYYKKRIIRFPCNKEKEIKLLEKTKNRLMNDLGRNPTIEEIVDELNFKEEYIYLLEKLSGYSCSSYESIDRNTVDGSSGYLDVVLNSSFLQDSLLKILNNMDQRKAGIIKCVYGICGENELSIDDVAKRFNFSTMRIRQIKNDFLVSIRKKYVHLKEYL